MNASFRSTVELSGSGLNRLKKKSTYEAYVCHPARKAHGMCLPSIASCSYYFALSAISNNSYDIVGQLVISI